MAGVKAPKRPPPPPPRARGRMRRRRPPLGAGAQPRARHAAAPRCRATNPPPFRSALFLSLARRASRRLPGSVCLRPLPGRPLQPATQPPALRRRRGRPIGKQRVSEKCAGERSAVPHCTAGSGEREKTRSPLQDKAQPPAFAPGRAPKQQSAPGRRPRRPAGAASPPAARAARARGRAGAPGPCQCPHAGLHPVWFASARGRESRLPPAGGLPGAPQPATVERVKGSAPPRRRPVGASSAAPCHGGAGAAGRGGESRHYRPRRAPGAAPRAQSAAPGPSRRAAALTARAWLPRGPRRRRARRRPDSVY